MSVELMRKAVEEVYPGEKWKNKVNKMRDSQVIAVYHRLLQNKKLK
jgi:hypothetical protein